jgi:hypothetical protein
MVSVSVCVTVVVAFDALTTMVNVPPVVGVPEITPLPVLTVSPGGRPVALKLVGKFVARMLYVNGWPTVGGRGGFAGDARGPDAHRDDERLRAGAARVGGGQGHAEGAHGSRGYPK